LHRLRFALYHAQKGARCAFRAATALLPVLDGIELKAESFGEPTLREAEATADGPDVDVLRYVDDEAFARAAGERERLSSSAQNAFTCL
jgi:hypothetical protein